MKFTQKLKTELLYDPAISLLGIYLKKKKIPVQSKLMDPSVHISIIYNS